MCSLSVIIVLISIITRLAQNQRTRAFQKSYKPTWGHRCYYIQASQAILRRDLFYQAWRCVLTFKHIISKEVSLYTLHALLTFVIVAHSHVVSDHVCHWTSYDVRFVGIHIHADAHGLSCAHSPMDSHPCLAAHKIFSTEN